MRQAFPCKCLDTEGEQRQEDDEKLVIVCGLTDTGLGNRLRDGSSLGRRSRVGFLRQDLFCSMLGSLGPMTLAEAVTLVRFRPASMGSSSSADFPVLT
jgi:hypothetical protein